MTEGLLNSTFHDKASGDRRRDLEEFRGQLADAVFHEVGKDLWPVAPGGQLAAVQEHTGRPGAGSRVPSARSRSDREAMVVAGPRRWRGPGPGNLRTRDGFGARASVAEVGAPEQRVFRVVAENGEVVWQGGVLVRPQRKWSVSLVHHTHLDVGYTDRQEVVTKNHLQYLDSVLELVDHTSAWEDDVRFRWNVEVNWPLERWFGCRSERDRRRMLDSGQDRSRQRGCHELEHAHRGVRYRGTVRDGSLWGRAASNSRGGDHQCYADRCPGRCDRPRGGAF